MHKLSNRISHGMGAVRGGGYALIVAAFALALLTACDSPTGPGPIPPGVDPTETPTPIPTPIPETPTPTPTPEPPDEPGETVPVIRSFVADPLTINAGDSSTLSWEVEDATSVEIDHGIGTVSLNGTRSVSPSSTTTYKLTAHGTGGDATATAQVKVISTPSATIDATISYYDYDDSTGTVTFRIKNNAGGATLESVEGHIVNRSTSANYYGPAYSNMPFRTSPTQTSIGDSSMSAGQTRYLRYYLSGKPVGVPCRATLKLFTADDRGGDSATKVVDFTLPGGGGSISATVTYYDYDASSGWVTFRIVNNSGGATLESVEGHIKNRSTSASYFGPSYSNSPFRTSPTQTMAGEPSMSAGKTRYLRFKLSGNPTGVPCRATLKLATADNLGGINATKIVDFTLPGGGSSINAVITYYSYDHTSGAVTFRIVNTGGVVIESAKTHVVNRITSASYYGPAYSNSIFRSSPTGSLGANVPIGGTRYMVYYLNGKPANGTKCRATISIHSQDGLAGDSVTKTVNFTLS